MRPTSFNHSTIVLSLILLNLVACGGGGGGSPGTDPGAGSGPGGGNGSPGIAGTRWHLTKMNGVDLPVKIGELNGVPDMLTQGELDVTDGKNFNLSANASITFSFAASYGVYTMKGNQINFSDPFWQDSFTAELRGRTLVIRYDLNKVDDTSNSDWDTEFTFELVQGSIGTSPGAGATDPNAASILNRWVLRGIEGFALPVRVTADDGSGHTIVIVEGRMYVWDAQAWSLTITLADFNLPYVDYGLYTVQGNVVTFSPSGTNPRFTGELRDGTLFVQYDLTRPDTASQPGMSVPPYRFAFRP